MLVELVVFDIEVIPATFNFLAIPTPPVITKAPSVEFSDSVSFVKVTSPSTFNFLLISAPPLTIKEAFVPEKSVVSVIRAGLLIETKPLPSVSRAKFPEVDLIRLSFISILSTTNLAAVAAIPTFNVSVSV